MWNRCHVVSVSKPFGGKLAIEGGYMDTLYTLDEATSSNDILFMERASG
jgi:phosphate-selective porin OprO and OprP